LLITRVRFALSETQDARSHFGCHRSSVAKWERAEARMPANFLIIFTDLAKAAKIVDPPGLRDVVWLGYLAEVWRRAGQPEGALGFNFGGREAHALEPGRMRRHNIAKLEANAPSG